MSADLVYKLDRQITADPQATVCVNDPLHGKLFPHKTGAGLICGKCGFAAGIPVLKDNQS